VLSKPAAYGLSFVCPLVLSAQSLQVQVVPSEESREGSVTVKIVSPAGKEPLALQWDFSLPVSIRLNSQMAVPGEAATQAQKSVRCAILANREGKDQICRCILAGGTSPIPSGPVAVVQYSATRGSQPGTYALHIRKALAVSSDNKKVDLKDTQTEIRVAK
jgi:hypothetical protein